MEKPGCFEASALMYIAGKKITYMDEPWLEKANKWQRHRGLPSGYNKGGSGAMVNTRAQTSLEIGSCCFLLFYPPSPHHSANCFHREIQAHLVWVVWNFRLKFLILILVISPNLNKLPRRQTTKTKQNINDLLFCHIWFIKFPNQGTLCH